MAYKRGDYAISKLDPSSADGRRAPAQAEAIRTKLLRRIEDLENRQRNPLFSIIANSEDRKTINSLNRYDREAINTALDFRNRTLRAGAEAQSALAAEVFEALLVQELSTIKTNLIEHWGREALRLHRILEGQSDELQERIIELLNKAEDKPDLIKRMMQDRAELMLRSWQSVTEQVLTDFTSILQA
ncbi:MAG: hypothetical protein AAGF87_14885 [Bacteroidota bacterium]